MFLKDILKTKGDTVYTITPEETVEDAVRKLVEHNIGSLLVCPKEDGSKGQLAGIITERDILHACASGKCAMGNMKVAEAMTAKLITGSPDDIVENVMGLMTAKRIRHLPVLLKDKLVGMVSIGDVVKAQHDRLAMENQFMKDYIQS
ncbi:MAG TPA: CBS domain-containing protein [Thermoguttaceae bacterium]|nr:CBS domain-containing protein [Thermoguttaceae bacterium]